MTIKNERVVAKIRALSRELHVDQVSAVEMAVDALASATPNSAAEQRVREALAIASSIRECVPSGFDWEGEDLYDEAGLPR